MARRDFVILVLVLIMGLFYYQFANSKDKALRSSGFILKMALLTLSFLLAFTSQDFLIIGDWAFGGRSPVMMIALIDIADELTYIKDQRRKKTNSYKLKRKMDKVLTVEKPDMKEGIITEVKVCKNGKDFIYDLKIDFGKKIGLKESSFILNKLYDTDDLLGKHVICRVQLDPIHIFI